MRKFSINKQKIQMIGLLTLVVLVASGCVSYDAAGNPSGWIYEYLGRPATLFLDWLANVFGGSYGIAIIIVTIITRLLMMPSSVNMTKNSMISQARMKIAQPEIDEIKADIEATSDAQEQAALNQELMAVYKKYDIDMFGGLSGCLPLVIQMPIISAVYAAIRSSEEIRSSVFLGINLGEQSIPLVIVVVLVTAAQGWLMQKNTPQADNAQAAQTNRTMMLMNPLMIGWISWISAAGLGLYFLAGGIFALVQQMYTNKIVRPKIKALVAEEEAKHKNSPRKARKPRATQTKSDGTTQRLVPTKNTPGIETNNRRNAGKQNKK